MGPIIDAARITLITATLLAIAALTKPEAVSHYQGKVGQWWQQTTEKYLSDSNESSSSSPRPSDEESGSSDDWGF